MEPLCYLIIQIMFWQLIGRLNFNLVIPHHPRLLFKKRRIKYHSKPFLSCFYPIFSLYRKSGATIICIASDPNFNYKYPSIPQLQQIVSVPLLPLWSVALTSNTSANLERISASGTDNPFSHLLMVCLTTLTLIASSS